MFDLSTFSEGSLCLFDVYERNPSLILELEEVKSQKNEPNDTVFDYLLTKINDDEPDKKIALTKNSYKGILLILNTKKKVQEDENSRIITNLLNLIKKSLTTKKYFNETTQDDIKKYAKDLNKKILSLIVSEPFLKVRFIFTKDDEVYDDSEFREWSIKTEITEYVIVSVDTFEVLETYPADSLNEKYKDMLVETTPQGTSLNAEKEVDLNAEEIKPKMQTIAESKSMSFKEPVQEPSVKEPVKESVKSEPLVKGSSLNGPTKAKTRTKASEKKATKIDPSEVDLNAIDEAEPSVKMEPSVVEPSVKEPSVKEPSVKAEPETKTKSRKTRTPKKEIVEETKTEPETKSKKIKTPGTSIRTKLKTKGEE